MLLSPIILSLLLLLLILIKVPSPLVLISACNTFDILIIIAAKHLAGQVINLKQNSSHQLAEKRTVLRVAIAAQSIPTIHRRDGCLPKRNAERLEELWLDRQVSVPTGLLSGQRGHVKNWV
uniref:Putative secreted protein n=1 Tax=Ixodes ricinus TaxID=34613 RepID=A0A147BFL3_IXORI